MRNIVWKKWENPIKYLNSQGEESENSNIMLQNTPFGIIPVKISSEMYNNKNIFVGNTNFDIDDTILLIIEDTPGVESLELISSYRFKIIIGLAFNVKAVLRKIRNRLCVNYSNYEFSVEDNQNIYRESCQLRLSGKPWFIYVLPNGKYESKSFDNQQQLEENITKYNNIRDRIGGVIITE